MEGRPQLLYPKFQRLKNSTKLAKVVLVDEMPQLRQSQQQNTATAATTRKSGVGNQTTTAPNISSEGSNLDGNQSQISAPTGIGASRNKPFEKASPKFLMYYPEEVHTPNE